eukprot:31514-Pelagococcus_subviridis.AAC.3
MTSRLPNCCRIVASIVSPTTRAASTASSSVKSSEPHLPTTRLPSAFRGTWPLRGRSIQANVGVELKGVSWSR